MKSLCMGVSLTAALVLVGCADSPPGGPGATKTTTTTRPGDTAVRPTPDASIPGERRDTGIGTPDNTFRLDVPNFETNIKQGETKTLTIGISRGTNFDQDVNLVFSGVPKGVTMGAAATTLRAADKNATVNVQAANDAAIGKHEITVTATPKTGAPTSAKFQIEVKKAT